MFGDPRLSERFWNKVMTEPNTGCWLWFGWQNRAGVGQLKTAGKRESVNRLVFRALVGEPTGRVLQRCGEKSCCNPQHLYSGGAYSRTNEYKNKREADRRAADPAYKQRRYALNRKLYAEDSSTARRATKRWQEQNPDKVRRYALVSRLRKYGLTEQEYASILEKQEGRCGVCRSDLTALKSKFVHIDHCHASGRVRGILCTKCNAGLGQFDDDERRLLNAITYLKEASRGAR